MSWWKIAIIVYVWMSGITFALYAWDKWRAKREGPRVAENTLHLMEFLGGWPGALLALTFVHHKTHKKSFLVILYAIVFLHLVVWSTVAWSKWGPDRS
jgi:uncharacterized membrane protein YsdA (DUF1294 family)